MKAHLPAHRADGEQPRKLSKSVPATALLLSLLVAFTAAPIAHAAGPSAVGLGTAGTYGVLAGDTITNTGATTIIGDLGLFPGTAVTGSPTVIGTSNVNNPAAHTAKNDLRTAYLDAAGRTGASPIVADLGGQTLTPGVYNTASGIGITGTLTLNAHGDTTAVWIFQAGSTLTAHTSSRVVLTNGAQPCNVFWQVGKAATLNASTTFVGTIMAHDDISVLDSVTVAGRLLAGAQANGAGALTLKHDTITKPLCSTSGLGGLGPPPQVQTAHSSGKSGSASSNSSDSSGSSASTSGSGSAPRAGAAHTQPQPQSSGFPIGLLLLMQGLIVLLGGVTAIILALVRRRGAKVERL